MARGGRAAMRKVTASVMAALLAMLPATLRAETTALMPPALDLARDCRPVAPPPVLDRDWSLWRGEAVDIPCEVNGRRYLLIATAGLRRKAKIHDEVETFSALQAARSIKRADLCLLIVDCAAGAMMQDRKIAQIIVNEQKPCKTAKRGRGMEWPASARASDIER